MKKQILLLSLALMLASCGGNPTDSTKESSVPAEGDSSQIVDSSSSSESKEEPVDEIDVIKGLLDNAKISGKASVKMSTGTTLNYLGEDIGVLAEYDGVGTGENQGLAYVKVPQYGIYQADYINSIAGLDNFKILTPNHSLKMSELAGGPALIDGIDAAEFTKNRDGSYTTYSEDLVSSLVSTLGADEIMEYYSVALANINHTGDTELTIKLSFKTPTATGTEEGVKNTYEYGACTMSEIATCSNKFVNDYLASKPTFSKPTDWDTETKEYFDELATGFSAPLPTKATYASVFNHNYETALMFTDYGCGNICNSYKNTVAALPGFSMSSDSEPSENLYIYEKEQTAPSGWNTGLKLFIGFMFDSATGYEAEYPNGAFMIFVWGEETQGTLTVSDVTTELNSHKKHTDALTNAIPALDLSTADTIKGTKESLESLQETCAYYELIYQLIYGVTMEIDASCYITLEVYYTLEATADAAITSWASALTAAGYVLDTEESYPSYDLEESDGWIWNVAFMKAVNADDVYQGYVMLVIQDSKIVEVA